MHVVLMGLVLVLSGAADAEESIDLGGLRRASARIRTVGDEYRIDVRMTPIVGFDESTNREMNQGIARACAIKALARHLKQKRLVVSGVRILKSRGDEKSFALTLQVPTDRVRVVDAETPSDRNADLVVGDGSLFTRKAEYEQTILQLEQTLARELDMLVARRKTDPESVDRASFGSLCKKIDVDFERLGKEIRGDLELSTIGSDLDPDDPSERDQLLKQLARSRERLRTRTDEVLKALSRSEKP
jgi:hypothetical protein